MNSYCCSSASYHVTLSTNLRNWPSETRGLAIGLPIASYGLSAFVFSTAAKYFFQTRQATFNVTAFLVFVGMITCLLNLFTGVYFRKKAQTQEYQNIHSRIPSSTTSQNEEEISLSDDVDLMELMEPVPLFKQFDSYLIGISMFSICGTGLMYINNVGTMLSAITTDKSELERYQHLHVSLLSIFSFLGRALTGISSDILFRRCHTDRILWPTLANLFMLLGCLRLLTITEIQTMWQSTVIIGFSYGMIWTSIPVLVGIYFGAHTFATNW
jgi:hypothetical protein